jgi:hypothetical protein
METKTQLIKYDQACQLLAEANNVDEVMEVRNVTKAMEYYARQAKDDQLRRDVKAIQLRATRKLGELIKKQKETVGLAKGGNPNLTGTSPSTGCNPTLAEAGISKNLSSQAQKLADIPEEEFEAGIQELTDPTKPANDIEITDEDREGANTHIDNFLKKKPKKKLKKPERDAPVHEKLKHWCQVEIERSMDRIHLPGVNIFEQQVIRRIHSRIIKRIAELKAIH